MTLAEHEIEKLYEVTVWNHEGDIVKKLWGGNGG